MKPIAEDSVFLNRMGRVGSQRPDDTSPTKEPTEKETDRSKANKKKTPTPYCYERSFFGPFGTAGNYRTRSLEKTVQEQEKKPIQAISGPLGRALFRIIKTSGVWTTRVIKDDFEALPRPD